MPKRRALLLGYYGRQNAGDDAFFLVTAWGARTFLGVEEVLHFGRQAPDAAGIAVRNLFPFASTRGTPDAVNRAWASWKCSGVQHVIFGGGSIFHSTRDLQHYSTLVRHAGLGPHFAVGVSIGPFRDAHARIECATLFRQLAFVGVRDEASLVRARALATRATRVERTFDLAPLLPVIEATAAPGDPARRGLGVALCNYERFTGGDTDREKRRIVVVAEAIKKAAAAGLVDAVTLLDFNSEPQLGDRSVHESLAAAISSAVPVRQVPYSGNPRDLLAEIGRLKGILAMRMHAAVFAYCTGTPAAILAYHEKSMEWASMTSWPPELVLPVSRLDTAGVEEAIGQLMCSGSRPVLPLQDAIEAARRNWTWLGGLEP